MYLKENPETDHETYGEQEEERFRWRRVVDWLDKFMPGWRRNKGWLHYTDAQVLGDTALTTLRKLKERAENAERGMALLNEQVLAEHRRRQVSEQFRQDPEGHSKHWETSYTKRVVAACASARVGLPSITECTSARKALADAQELLTDYHKTMHTVYQQRDAARREATQLRGELVAARKVNVDLLKVAHKVELFKPANKDEHRLSGEGRPELPQQHWNARRDLWLEIAAPGTRDPVQRRRRAARIVHLIATMIRTAR